MTEEIEIPLASTDKYEEALAKARFEYEKNPCASEGEKRLLEIIFPELRESEDEKIKRAIGYAIGQSTHSDGTLIDGITREQAVAWLEKQKEYDMPSSTELIAKWNEEKKILQEKYEPGHPWRLAYNAFMDGFGYGFHVKQKEQEINHKGLHKGSLRHVDNPTKWMKEDDMEREQKPAEWSEEDKTALCDLMWCIEQARKFAKNENDMGNIWFAENWVKKRIKSLCPQPHWKPSEEQMYSLGTVVKGYDNCTVGSVGYNLKELYEDLKKL